MTPIKIVAGVILTKTFAFKNSFIMNKTELKLLTFSLSEI